MDNGDGRAVQYQLKELVGTEFSKWQNGNAKRFDGEGNLTDYTDYWASLISLCLFDDSGNRVPLTVIQRYSTTAQRILFNACNKLNSPTEEEAKKS